MEIKSISVKVFGISAFEGNGEATEFGLEATIQPEEDLTLAYRDAYIALLDAMQNSYAQRRGEYGVGTRGTLGSK